MTIQNIDVHIIAFHYDNNNNKRHIPYYKQ